MLFTNMAVLKYSSSENTLTRFRVGARCGCGLLPHQYPEDRVYTVISGIFYLGLGDQFDAEKLVAYPPGAVIILPGNTSHFHWAKSGAYVTQVTAIGPLGVEYINSHDDPRSRGSEGNT